MTLEQLRRLMPGANLTGRKLPFHENGLLVELDGWSRWIYVGDEPYPLTDIWSLHRINRVAGINLNEENVGAYLVLICGLMLDEDEEPFDLVDDPIEVLGTDRHGNITVRVYTVHCSRVVESLISVLPSGGVTLLTDDVVAILPDGQPVSSARS